MTTVYLAWVDIGSKTLAKHADKEPVNLLVAYPFLEEFQKVRGDFNIGKLIIDSGAYTVHNSGGTVDLQEYIDTCKEVEADEFFGLDVIGDWRGTQKNLEIMWEAGVNAIPTWHAGEPWEHLEWCAKYAGKIALSGTGFRKGAGEWGTFEWIQQAMARVWPKKVHFLGQTSSKALLDIAPFHSADSSSWQFGPNVVGRWAGFTGKALKLSARGIRDYWVEVEECQRRERAAAWRWRKELKRLEEMPQRPYGQEQEHTWKTS